MVGRTIRGRLKLVDPHHPRSIETGLSAQRPGTEFQTAEDRGRKNAAYSSPAGGPPDRRLVKKIRKKKPLFRGAQIGTTQGRNGSFEPWRTAWWS